MKEILSQINKWTDQNKPFVIATVTKTWGSSPRPVGSTMIISEDMEMAGSVSGGCVENAVIQASLPLLKTGKGKRLAFGIADEDAWEVGLSCGGKLQVFAETFPAFSGEQVDKHIWKELNNCLTENLGCVYISRLEEAKGEHFLFNSKGESFHKEAPNPIKEQAQLAYSQRKHLLFEFEDQEYIAQVFPRKSQMLIIGAAHITVDLVELGKMFGFETIVIDPRGVFTQKTQFTTPPDQIFEDYPSEVLSQFELDPYTYAVVLSHDPKIDDNALHQLLPSDVAYIGALGSRKNQEKRRNRMIAAGFSEEQIGKISGPIGVNINAKTPKEIALSIMAEIIQVKNQYGR